MYLYEYKNVNTRLEATLSQYATLATILIYLKWGYKSETLQWP